MSDAPFTFEGCTDAAACRDGISRLIATSMDWSEVHCGRCGQQGIVRHADLQTPAAPAPAPALAAAEPAPEPEPAPAAAEPRS